MILVTGATGFLGHNLIPRLARAGQPLRALVRRHSHTARLQEYGVELAYAEDITDLAAATQACRGCQAVIHAAGHFRFWGEPDAFWRTNVIGTETILSAAAAAGIQRFIHISTVVVVGHSAAAVIDETTPCQPQDAYQESKLVAEQRVLAAWRHQGLPAIVLRPGAFYGPFGRYAFNRLFFEEPLRGWRIKVNGGRHITFPAFVPDVAQGIELSLSAGRPGEIYNICGDSLTHNAANDIISHLAGISPFRLPVPVSAARLLARVMTAAAGITRREPFYANNLAHYVFQDWPVSNAKAQAELGFRPTPFVDGARETLAWYWQAGILPPTKRRQA